MRVRALARAKARMGVREPTVQASAVVVKHLRMHERKICRACLTRPKS
jgi:hypothetical protein